ncbi:small subunit ribosomal protein S24e, partial [Tremellales sp. Uapishka_1]
PTTRARSPSPAEDLPKTFFTRKFLTDKAKEEAWAEKKQRRQAFTAPQSSKTQETVEKSLLDRISNSKAVEGSSSSTKRPQSPTPISSEPPAKVAKSIPTGPKSERIPQPSGPSIPTGPRSERRYPLLTYPRPVVSGSTSGLDNTSNVPATAIPSPASPRSRPRSPRPKSPLSSSNEMPPRYRGGTSNGNGNGRKGAMHSVVQLSGPVNTHEQIMAQHGNGISIKQQWLENPKAPLANYLGGGTGGSTDFGDGGKGFKVEEGLVGNAKIVRVSVVGDGDRNIIGVGDSTSRKEAEKLAALSAVLQLSAAGLLDGKNARSGGKSSNGTASSSSANQVSGGSNETARLSDGSEINYDRARQFMEYYCHRYKFGKPEVEFSSASTKRKGKGGSATQWDAVMAVGGRRIGMGSAASKKSAQTRCYLDVTQYLESCDSELWRNFLEHSKKDTSANLGMAPHIVFQMSETLSDEIQGLCGDIKHSLLYKNAPQSAVAAPEVAPAAWNSSRRGHATEKDLDSKSLDLQDKLAAYQNDPRLDRMRAQRNSLPVTSRATDILATIEINDVTIVMAATGSGKTTQIPQLLFDDYINRGQGARCNIICTQPRRLAAMSVAERVAEERGDNIGREVGYQVRFDVKLPQPNGCITFCTTGIFLKRMQSALGTNNPGAVADMDTVTHIVVDEVHERDIDTDLLLVVLKRLIADRKARNIPVKVVLMSATIDPSLFQKYFADLKGRLAPVAEVPGRTFPVERHYLDEIVQDLRVGLPTQMGGWVFQDKKVDQYLQKELSTDPRAFIKDEGITGGEAEIPYPLVALTIAFVMKRSDDGHVLVFLPGWEEIKKVADILLDQTGRYPLLGTKFTDASKYSVHYLHSTIPAAEQKEVFKPPPKGVRRIILATNIAETSITIPDVVYVVDTARVKEKRYDPERHMSSLVSAWVGSSNLNQRAGRAGRHREGEYYGLVSKRRLESLHPHQLVEMKRSDLSNVVMHVKALNLGEVEEVLAATIEPPEPSRVIAAMEVLRMLGAMDGQKNLTSLGRVLLQLPVEAAIGKLCLYGSFFRCLDSALTLAAILTNRDPFMAPLALKQQAEQIKDSWSPTAFRSDPLAIVAAYKEWSAMDDRAEYQSANRFCSDNFLSKPTMLQIKQVKGSLLQSLDQAGVIAVSAGGKVARIGRQLQVPAQLNEHGSSLPMLAALIAMASAPNFAIRTSEKMCRTSQDKSVFIHSSSVNSRRRETGGPEEPSASFNPAEKRIYAFGEKSRNVPPGGNPNSAQTQLRVVTRLDPMTYMLFGAYNLYVTQRGLECDNWLPVIGNLHALDDIQRMKTLLDSCMLRVFEGVGKSLVKGRDERFMASRKVIDVRRDGSSRINPNEDDDLDQEGENESDDEDLDPPKEKKKIEPLGFDEIKELELLTTDVVRILDAYAAERETSSRYNSRPVTPSFAGGRGAPNGGGNTYRAPIAQSGLRVEQNPRKW